MAQLITQYLIIIWRARDQRHDLTYWATRLILDVTWMCANLMTQCGACMTRTPLENRRRLAGGALEPQEGILRHTPNVAERHGCCNVPRCLARCAL